MMMFRQGWKEFDKARPGTFRLVPKEQLSKDIERDYKAMQGMVLGDGPSFNEIIDAIERLEQHLNAKATVSTDQARRAI